MAIRFANDSAEAFDALHAGLRELASHGAFTGNWAPLASPDLKAAGPQRIYVTSNATADGRPLDDAVAVGWRYLLVVGDEALAVADVARLTSTGALGITAMHLGQIAQWTAEALQAGSAFQPNHAFEARLLRLPAAGIEALWLHGLQDVFIATSKSAAIEPLAFIESERLWYESDRAARSAPQPLPSRRLPAVLLDARSLGDVFAVGDPPMTKVLNFLIQNQEQTNWCWLAIAASIWIYYTNDTSKYSQCQLANACLGQVTCCADPSTPQCNKPGWSQTSMQTATVWSSTMSATPTFASVRAAIVANQPIGTAITGAGAVGHAQVIFGFTDPSVIYVADPWNATNFVTDYTAYPGAGLLWAQSYWSKHP